MDKIINVLIRSLYYILSSTLFALICLKALLSLVGWSPPIWVTIFLFFVGLFAAFPLIPIIMVSVIPIRLLLFEWLKRVNNINEITTRERPSLDIGNWLLLIPELVWLLFGIGYFFYFVASSSDKPTIEQKLFIYTSLSVAMFSIGVIADRRKKFSRLWPSIILFIILFIFDITYKSTLPINDYTDVIFLWLARIGVLSLAIISLSWDQAGFRYFFFFFLSVLSTLFAAVGLSANLSCQVILSTDFLKYAQFTLIAAFLSALQVAWRYNANLVEDDDKMTRQLISFVDKSLSLPIPTVALGFTSLILQSVLTCDALNYWILIPSFLLLNLYYWSELNVIKSKPKNPSTSPT